MYFNHFLIRFNTHRSSNTLYLTVVIGLEEYGGIIPEEGIPLLRSSLLREGVINEALKPVKETVSAGKSLFNWSQSLAGWMSRLIRSN